jgi:hypothetical protein
LDALQGPVMDAVFRYGSKGIPEFFAAFARSDLFTAMLASGCGKEWLDRVRDLALAFAPPADCTAYADGDIRDAVHVAACPTRPGWEGHLGRVARWHAEVTWAPRFLETAADPSAGLRVLRDLPQYLEPLDPEARDRVGRVILGLGTDPALSGSLVADLGAKTDYLPWLATGADVEQVVEHDPDVRSGWTAPKAVYVLVTSYPARDDPSLLDRHLRGEEIPADQIADQIRTLTRQSAAQLSSHKFTAVEVVLGAVEKVSDAADFASFAAAPITGGASIAIVAARKLGMAALKWAARTAAKRSLATASKLAGRAGGKVAIREWKHLLVAESLGPGRPPTGSRAIRRWIDGSLEKANNGGAAAILIGYLIASRLGEDDDLDTCPR